MTAPAPVRIALTISSGASLGAYEAGATAGLLVALQRLNQRDHRDGRPPSVRLSAVAATSAGALVGLLAARCLLAGLDPVAVLHAGWVEEASLRRLTDGATRAPLSLTAVRDAASGLLDPRDRRGRPLHRVAGTAVQDGPIGYAVGLGNLQGLTYPIQTEAGGPVHSGLTHADLARFTLSPGDDRDRYVRPARSSPLDAALAAMSHPALFAPHVLDRRPDAAGYVRAGVRDFPRSGHFWYADGGALVRDPLGAAIEAARGVERSAWTGDGADARLVHVLVRPHTAPPDSEDRWTRPDRMPDWSDTLVRLVTTLTVEAQYHDLRGIEDVNERLRRLDRFADALAPHLTHGAEEALRGLLPDRAGGPPSELLRCALREAGGVTGKAPVATEVVSPLRLVQSETGVSPPDGQDRVPAMLAGEFLVRFGGFDGRALRHSDFVLGWQSTRAWIPGALRRAGLPDAAVSAAVGALDERDVRYGPSGRRGNAGLGDVPLGARLRMAGVLARAGAHLVGDVLGRRSRRPGTP